jgi:hypothetical protein
MMRRVWTLRLTAIFTALLASAGTSLSGPAFAQDSLSPEAVTKNQPQTSCIFFARLYDWTPINDTNLILWGSRTQSYHLQLMPPCNGLRFASGVGFTSKNGERRLCTMDSVVVDNGPGIPERCLIRRMIELDAASLQALLAQAPGREEGRGRKEKPASATP